jgi:hypothetical protein
MSQLYSALGLGLSSGLTALLLTVLFAASIVGSILLLALSRCKSTKRITPMEAELLYLERIHRPPGAHATLLVSPTEPPTGVVVVNVAPAPIECEPPPPSSHGENHDISEQHDEAAIDGAGSRQTIPAIGSWMHATHTHKHAQDGKTATRELAPLKNGQQVTPVGVPVRRTVLAPLVVRPRGAVTHSSGLAAAPLLTLAPLDESRWYGYDAFILHLSPHSTHSRRFVLWIILILLVYPLYSDRLRLASPFFYLPPLSKLVTASPFACADQSATTASTTYTELQHRFYPCASVLLRAFNRVMGVDEVNGKGEERRSREEEQRYDHIRELEELNAFLSTRSPYFGPFDIEWKKIQFYLFIDEYWVVV